MPSRLARPLSMIALVDNGRILANSAPKGQIQVQFLPMKTKKLGEQNDEGSKLGKLGEERRLRAEGPKHGSHRTTRSSWIKLLLKMIYRRNFNP